MYITNKSKRINEDRVAATKLIEACDHFGIDPKMVARIISAVQASLPSPNPPQPSAEGGE